MSFCRNLRHLGKVSHLDLSVIGGDIDSSEELETAKPTTNEETSPVVPDAMPQIATQKPDSPAGAADGEKEGSSNLYRIDSGLLPFPEKLMALLDGNQVSGAFGLYAVLAGKSEEG